MSHVLIIDNYDSFTFNLKSYFQVLGVKVSVYSNDGITISEIREINPTHLVLSPGPGNPNDAGISLEVIKSYYQYYPILGVCLGHQCIAKAFGGRIVNASQVMHGKVSTIAHDGRGLYAKLPATFTVTRYHSLMVDLASLPAQLELAAWCVEKKNDTKSKTIMGLRHKDYPLFGLQYHPEAILTEQGYEVLKAFLET